MRRRGFIVQGHRGARGVLPENTVAGFRHALRCGVDRIEVDVNLSADRRLVLVHDETTSPDLVRIDGAWVDTRTPWHALTFDRIRRFDVGRIRPESAYARRYPRQAPRDGSRVPLLEELAALLIDEGDARAGLTLEMKCDPAAIPPRPDPARFAAVLVDEIHRLRIAARVSVQSFNWRVVAEVRRLDPGLAVGCLTSRRPPRDNLSSVDGNPSPWTAAPGLDDPGLSTPARVRAMGVHYWSSDYRDLDPESVALAHELGLAVHCWTVNDAAAVKRLLSWTVDSIISDYPQSLIAAVEEHEAARRGAPD